VFVVDETLQNIPISALYDGDQYLIEKYQIAIAPNMQILNPQPKTRDRLQVLLGALTEGSREYSALPGVQEEVKNITATVPAKVLLDRQFTNAKVKSELQEQPFSVMHLATHGQFSSKAEETFIVTWDGHIGIKELNNMLSNRNVPDLPPIDLLVLSACETAKGDKRATLGLAGVALQSGTRSTLASLWTVNDTSTADFMQQFYQELLKPKTTKAEAVRQAQIYLLRQPQYRHPYYWSPFILIGNWL
jgi:CHAT domain-containing protein